MASLPSLSLIRLGGLPTEPPELSTGRLRKLQLLPLSLVLQASMKCSGPSFRRIVVRMRDGDRRTEEGMMEKPSGSGPIHDTLSHVRPPSLVRIRSTRPSRPFSFDAVMNA